MALSAEKLRVELFARIDQAQVHHDLLIALRDCTEVPGNLIKLNRNIRFFAGVEAALFNSAVVLLYTLYETRQDTINFYRLIDALEGKASNTEMETYRERVRAVKPLWLRVGVLRNEMVGHQSMTLYSDPDKAKARMGVSEVDALLSEAKALLSEISRKHFHTGISFMEGTRKAVDVLLSRLTT